MVPSDEKKLEEPLIMSMKSIKIHPSKHLWDSGGGSKWYNLEDTGCGWCSWTSRCIKRSLLGYIGLELVIYLVLYYIIHVIYRAGLSYEQQKQFQSVVLYFQKNLSPMSKDLTFLLGFYVSLVAKRWWDQYKLLPWPDNLGILLNGLVVTDDRRSGFLRDTIMRYTMLTYVLCLRRLSKAVNIKYPDSTSLVKAGLALEEEVDELQCESDGSMDRQWWIPLSWAMTLVKQGKLEKAIPSDHKELFRGLCRFRQELQCIESYQHIPIPPVYKQVVLIAVYSYFGLALISGQEVIDGQPVLYFPIFLILRFIFFIGWLKVADAISNPFGEDEDDFQLEELLSRHIWASGRTLEQFKGAPVPEKNLNNKRDIEDETEVTSLDLNKKHKHSISGYSITSS